MFDTLLLLVTGLLAGALNAVAGGGSFLTLPALVFTGMSPVMANATGTCAQLPGYLASAWGYRRDLQSPPGLSLRAVLAFSLAGAGTGATLLLLTPSTTFQRLVPWLLLLATLAFALGPRLRQLSANAHRPASTTQAGLGMFVVATYGGYFNGGLGIILLALFSLLGQTHLHSMNGLKNVVSVLLAGTAVVIYAIGGLIDWPQALLMMLGTVVGGYGAARLAQHIPHQWLRWGVVLTGLVMTAVFFARTY